ncbi:MAG: KilA-N domain-containing protein, partial [bacterium]
MVKIKIKNQEITINLSNKGDDYISLTDIARYKNPHEPKDVVKSWMKNRNTIEFLSIWEKINNPRFKGDHLDPFKKEVGLNSFTLSPERWINNTGAIGIKTSKGRYGSGTFAHKDIAFEFASWISSEFKLYLIKEFQRLKTEENERLNLGWDVKRLLTKINYKIHTDSIRDNIVLPKKLSGKDAIITYANEADVLNVALFGMTAKEWRNKNPKLEGNIRDYADVLQLVCLV